MLLKKTYKLELYKTALIAFLLVLLIPLSAAAASVSGKYIKVSGNTTVLQISVGKPAPPSIIVEQSPGNKNKVQSARPKPKKISGNGTIKWLLTKIRPGKQQFTVTFASPLKGSVRAILRYRDPSSGQFIEKSITP